MIRHANFRTAAPDTASGTNWTRRAACAGVGVNVMFPGSRPEDIDAAKAVCARCPVTIRCGRETLEIEGNATAEKRHGVFAGLTGKERRRVYEELERRRKATA
ncbi:WhiB family transcriptional regulator [Streptomyces sp. NPDC050095]|uniref:WhiB family transcriptional regulator n=1 Tax=unclassified Streptomyces TaxID=2593676 RepID=UPI00341643FC